MTSPSSTSSSSGLAVAPVAPSRAALTPTVARLASRWRGRLRRRSVPAGAVFAVAWIAIFHVIAAGLVYPDAQPRRDLRRKLNPLTRTSRPVLVVAGDSRAECGLLPAILAGYAGCAAGQAINMATPACDLPGVLAGYRSYADRMATSPIMLISVSAVEINDRAAEHLIGDETLASCGPIERFRLVPFKRALVSLALPERELVRRLIVEPLFWRWDESHAADGGYRGKRGHHAYSSERMQREMRYIADVWYREPVLDGIRWRLFAESVQALRDAGVQVVILDPPAQPAFVNGIDGTPVGEADAQFHRRLAGFCAERRIPLLRHTAESLAPEDPAGIFVSLMHLNREGAERLSHRVGQDLQAMLREGRLMLPQPEGRDR